jgi:3-hydroxyacyl-[acyl-carrier-protein] dehydratase
MFELMESLSLDGPAGVARGRARVPLDHPFLADHFPGVPILPGSLQIELCAQIAGPLAEAVIALRHGLERWSFLGMVRNATFHAPAHLPASLEITVEARRAEPTRVELAASLTRDDGLMLCRVELVMMMRDAEPTWSEAIGRYRERIAAWKTRA